MKPKICVVGSANIDQISYVQRIPIDGETIRGFEQPFEGFQDSRL